MSASRLLDCEEWEAAYNAFEKIMLQVTWFNNPYAVQKLELGQEYYFQGIVTGGMLRRQMVNPQVRTEAQITAAPFEAVYPQTEGLTSNAIAKCPHVELLPDPLPPGMLKKYRLLPKADAVRAIHCPASEEEAFAARRRLIYEELLVLQLGIGRMKNRGAAATGAPMQLADPGPFWESLPFSPTGAQRRAVEKADIIVRFQGGANAGHTIVNNYGKFALHTLPSGVFYNHTTSVIGNGVALNIPILMKEIKSITDRNVPMPKILVSDRAQMVMPYHILFDQYEEERLGGKSFGSTKSGIAPFYSDKYAKIGFQVSELFDDELLEEKVQRVSEMKNVILEHLYHKPLIDPAELLNTLHEYRDMIAPFVCDVSAFLDKALKEGKTILLEGQLGTMKDPDHGIYPMVTSSSTLAAYGAIGAGIPPYEIKQIVTVSKAYSSAVGAGAFVSEIFGDEADELRRRGGDGGEFGATTGRPRRMGWFDCVATKYGCRLQGATDVAFTVLDALGYLEEIPVCVGYEIDGEVTTDFPVTYKLEKAKPVLKKLPGWKCDIRGIKKFEDLPENCRKYVEFIEEQIGFPITMVSNGPGREDIIYRESPLKK